MEHNMPMIAVDDGVRLHVQDLGKGPVVVLISGFGLDQSLWDRQVRVLTAAGHRTVCITQRGHARSDQPLGGYEISRLSADVVAVLDALAISSATLVGHSFGGQVAFHTAAVAPERATKLVLVGSSIRASDLDAEAWRAKTDPIVAKMVQVETDDRISARYELIRSSFAVEPDPRLADWLMSTFMQMPTWAAIASYDTLLRANFVRELALVRQPVLQINSKRDPVHSVNGGRWLHDHLHDPTLVELECGHFPMLEMPIEFDHALTRFL
jgi:pimeloyl-ACP methyl ester carboxylesterase